MARNLHLLSGVHYDPVPIKVPEPMGSIQCAFFLLRR